MENLILTNSETLRENPDTDTRIEKIVGQFMIVSSAPTWSPRRFQDSFAVDETNSRFYWYDFENSAWKYASSSPVSIADGGTGATDAATALSNLGGISKNVSVTAGETLTAGEVVRLQVGTGNNATQGYSWTNGTAYACRAAANDTTYGVNVIGIISSAATYLGTGYCTQIGSVTGLSGLTAASKYYLKNYSAGSSLDAANTQTQQDTEFNITTAHTLMQIWIPTSSRLDKVILRCRKNGGAAEGVTVKVFRSNTEIATATTNVGPNSASLSEFTFDFTDVQTYKGELLNFRITTDSDYAYIGYQSGGDVYAPIYGPTGVGTGNDLTILAGGGAIAAASDLYMKIYEFTDFGVMATSTGTRTYKMGIALSATELLEQIQERDATL